MDHSDDKSKIETYGKTDHAQTYRALTPGLERDTPDIRADYENLMRDGYVIIENLLDLETLEFIKTEAAKLLGKTGRNPFEGIQTQRVYDVLSKTRASDALAEHPRILGLLDRLFEPNFLLSQSQMINIHSGEAAQTLHFDDGFYRIPRPNRKDAISAIMPAGSVVIFLGTTWHGGGQNRSEAPRLAVTHQYCEGYLRQQENYLLELSRETVRSLSPQMRALVGYSVHPPFMGMVNGQHPLRVIE